MTLHRFALLTPRQSDAADHAAVGQGVSVARLMDHAGWAVASTVRRLSRPVRTVVLCGPGNNGGDGYVAARYLAAWGWPVTLAAWAPPRGPALEAARLWRGPMAPFTPATVARADLVIDAVFGAGLTRPLPDDVTAVLRAARRVVAVDVPSGLDGGTGQMLSDWPGAALTVSFVRGRPGHLLLPGRLACGDIWIADIGLPEAALAGLALDVFHNRPGLWGLRASGADDNKYTRGHVTILGGGVMPGAARLAAAAARRCGAGLVSIAAAHPAVFLSDAPGLLVTDAPLPDLLQDARRTVWLAGPGLTVAEAQAALPRLCAAGRHLVVDAGGLTACAGQPELLRGASVLTPHDGEFSRLFGPPGLDRVAACRATAALTGAVVLLKGPATIVAAPDGRAAITSNAPPSLATAGAGDVLAGIIAANLAQGMLPWDAACAAAWLHGAAAAAHGAGLVAEDLPGGLPMAIHRARLASPAPTGWLYRGITAEPVT